MKDYWQDDIVEIIGSFGVHDHDTLDEIYSRAKYKISKLQLLEILIMGVQADYLEVVRDERGVNRYCTTEKGTNYAANWYL